MKKIISLFSLFVLVACGATMISMDFKDPMATREVLSGFGGHVVILSRGENEAAPENIVKKLPPAPPHIYHYQIVDLQNQGPRIVLVFNPTQTWSDQRICGALGPNDVPPLRPSTSPIIVQGALCLGEKKLTGGYGQSDATSFQDPKYDALMRQLLATLFTPAPPDNDSNQEEVR